MRPRGQHRWFVISFSAAVKDKRHQAKNRRSAKKITLSAMQHSSTSGGRPLWSKDAGIGNVAYSRLPRPRVLLLRAAGERTLDHVTDRLPYGAVELHQTHLLDGVEVGRPGVERDARKRDRIPVASQGR